MFFEIVRNDKQLGYTSYRWMTFQGYTRSGVTAGKRGENRPTWQATCNNRPPDKPIFHF